MKRLIISAAIAASLALGCASQAQARIFEPQHHWWSSGRSCVASRNPPGLAWDDLPPRACVAGEDASYTKRPAQDPVNGKQTVLALASPECMQAGKPSDKA